MLFNGFLQSCTQCTLCSTVKSSNSPCRDMVTLTDTVKPYMYRHCPARSHVQYFSRWLFAHVSMACPGCMCGHLPRSESHRLALGGRVLVASRSPASASASSGSRPSLPRGDLCVRAAKGHSVTGGEAALVMVMIVVESWAVCCAKPGGA